MGWIRSLFEPAPYGAELAERVAAALEAGQSLHDGHRDYCGMGLAYQDQCFCYAEVWDGQLAEKKSRLKEAQGGARVFLDRKAFVSWLAEQTDKSLSRSDDANPFYHNNQTLNRERLIEFAQGHEAVPLLSITRWSNLWNAIPAPGDGRDWFGCVYGSYSEPHRHYHNLRHLQECLEELDQIRSLAIQPVLLETALWFHDVIYDPQTTSENEELSADLARDALESGGASSAFIKNVRTLILLTKHHTPDETSDASLMSDIDLAILGKDEARFDEYEQAIRREYAWVPVEAYVKGRTQVLERFLQRKRIYVTDAFADRYETTARCNLKRSLERLAGGTLL